MFNKPPRQERITTQRFTITNIESVASQAERHPQEWTDLQRTQANFLRALKSTTNITERPCLLSYFEKDECHLISGRLDTEEGGQVDSIGEELLNNLFSDDDEYHPPSNDQNFLSDYEDLQMNGQAETSGDPDAIDTGDMNYFPFVMSPVNLH